MIVSEAITKEVNQYYARRGGRRAVNTATFANFMQKASLSESQTSNSTERTESDTEAQTTEKSAATSRSKSTDTCCEQCRLTSQLMVQLMSRSLYGQSGLGYTSMGTGALNAYQNMIHILGNHTGLS